ncbi:MAG: type II toxin-antitoxin system VapC family toxin [Gammaproteobacteria bacterium]
MKLLLDTHVFLWANNEFEQLSSTATVLLSSGEHDLYLSIATPWEIQIKHQLGKLRLTRPVKEMVDKNLEENGIQLLPFTLAHICRLDKLPLHHKDPFDRIIIAQALLEDMAVVTVDQAFTDYSVPVIW